uniref:Uncharacterized protein n=1 Tax=Arundo donax TaxID=35708 RepID=A0A0A9FBE9_ARUDO
MNIRGSRKKSLQEPYERPPQFPPS